MPTVLSTAEEGEDIEAAASSILSMLLMRLTAEKRIGP